jgi:two-component system, OmpR family, phosphate regulon response regulator PhoB
VSWRVYDEKDRKKRSARTGGIPERSKKVTRPRILVVNDESALRDFFRINLMVRGCDVLVSWGSPEVLAIMQKEQPDLVILDLTVRGVDGFELCRQICQSSSSSVIAFNMRGNETDLLRCLELGVDDYLWRPFGVDELMARVWAVLRRKRLVKPSPPSSPAVENQVSMALPLAD